MASKTDAIMAMPSQAGLKSAAPPTFLAADELSVCENISYGLNAERKKRLGTNRYNAVTIGAAANIVALQDFWRFGTSLTPAQKFVMAGNAQLWQSPGDGTWTSIKNPFGSNTSLITNIVIAQGFAVFSDGSSIPQKYDQTVVTDLDAGAGTAPHFTAASYHLARLFAIGTAAHPSSFDVSAGGDITLWTGADALLNVPLNTDDGDALIGISRTFHKRVYMFKGPNYGSIHEISGNTLSTLQHDQVFSGLPLQNNKALITTPNDIFWLSKTGAHSLVTTQAYGDTQAAFLSEPIQDFFQTQLNQGALNQAVGFWHPLYGYVGWWVTPAGQTTNQWALVYHYLISDPSPRGKKFWSIWKLGGTLAAYSANVMITPSAFSGAGMQRLYLGGTGDGFVYAGDQTVLTDGNGSAYTARVKTGINLTLGQASPLHEKQFYCPDENVRVLTSDLRWVPAGELLKGDELLAFDEYGPDRKVSPSRVSNTGRLIRHVYRLTLADNTILRASAEHPWLCTKSEGRSFSWETTESLAQALSRGEKRGLLRFFKPWKTDTSYEAGYLAAAFDGEGHLTLRPGRGVICGFAQKKNEMLEAVINYLDHRKIKYNIWPNPNGVNNLTLRGRWSEHLAFLGEIQAKRLVSKFSSAVQENRFRVGCYSISRPEIINIESEGPQEVVALETTSHTYFAEGFGAHNSVTTYFEPVGSYSHDLNVTVDNRTQAFQVVMSGAGDVLG